MAKKVNDVALVNQLDMLHNEYINKVTDLIEAYTPADAGFLIARKYLEKTQMNQKLIMQGNPRAGAVLNNFKK